jgi:hypothetical protein
MNSYAITHLGLIQKTNMDVASLIMKFLRGTFLQKMEELLIKKHKKCNIVRKSMENHPNAIHYMIRLKERLSLQYSFTSDGDLYYASLTSSGFVSSCVTEIYPEMGVSKTYM